MSEDNGIVKVGVQPAPRHCCQAPSAREQTIGTIFVCPVCHWLSTVTNNSYRDDSSFNSWRAETRKERRKRWKRGYVYAAELR